MSKIEKELFNAISNEYINGSGDLYTDSAAKSCLSIVEKHAVNYKKYVLQYFVQVKRIEPLLYVKRNDKFASNVEGYDSLIYNEQDVFKMYMKSLEK